MEKLQYLFLSLANVQTLRIGKLEFESYFSDKEVKYVFFDKPIDRIRVLAACINEFQPIKKSSKELVKQILCQCIENEKEYDAPKNV